MITLCLHFYGQEINLFNLVSWRESSKRICKIFYWNNYLGGLQVNLITFRQDKHIKPMVTELFHTQLLRCGIPCQSVYAHVALSNKNQNISF